MSEILLDIEDLSISYDTTAGPLRALRHASLAARPGEVIGIVGESGCGKSTLVSAIINLLPGNARIDGGTIRLDGADILSLDPGAARRVRGRDIAMIFQDPMTAFNPVLTIGEQMADFQHHLDGLDRRERLRRAAEALERVGIPDAATILSRYPHELSGGMRQRAAIAAALLMTPSVLVADEPTTALDVTMEAQIIHLLRQLSADYQGVIVVVTHHLGVVAELCDRVYVMYAGQVVEEGPVDDIYHRPAHPYTEALIACDPAHFEEHMPILPTIGGHVPDLVDPPKGCSFFPRCSRAAERCRDVPPPRVLLSPGRNALCHEARP